MVCSRTQKRWTVTVEMPGYSTWGLLDSRVLTSISGKLSLFQWSAEIRSIKVCYISAQATYREGEYAELNLPRLKKNYNGFVSLLTITVLQI
jgi:hypothetical protein